MKKSKLEEHKPFLSRWRVSSSGYRLEERDSQTEDVLLTASIHPSGPIRDQWRTEAVAPSERLHGTWLVIADPADSPRRIADPYPTLVYNPLEKTGLHRTFAGIEIDNDGLVPGERIVEFANKHGFLGRRTECLTSKKGQGSLTWGESYADWLTEILRMRSLVRLWDLCQNPKLGALDELGELLVVGESKVILRWASLSHAGWINDGRDYESDLVELPPIADPRIKVRMAARILLRDAVNDELASGTDAAIEVKDGTPVLLIPKDLRGAMYVLFAHELIGKTVPPLACEACGAYFIPTHGRQKYCDERCRFKRYRRKKKDEKSNDGE